MSNGYEGVRHGLKPCPFCGTKAGTDRPGPVLTIEGYEDVTFSVHCMGCDMLVLGFIGNDFYSEKDAINAWNTRADNVKSPNKDATHTKPHQ
jgi:hypothetical protein